MPLILSLATATLVALASGIHRVYKSGSVNRHFQKSPEIAKLRSLVLNDAHRNSSLWRFLNYGPSHEFRFWKAVDSIRFEPHERLAEPGDIDRLSELSLNLTGSVNIEEKEIIRNDIRSMLDNIVFLNFAKQKTRGMPLGYSIPNGYDITDCSQIFFGYRPDRKIMLLKVDRNTNFADFNQVLFDKYGYARRVSLRLDQHKSTNQPIDQTSMSGVITFSKIASRFFVGSTAIYGSYISGRYAYQKYSKNDQHSFFKFETDLDMASSKQPIYSHYIY